MNEQQNQTPAQAFDRVMEDATRLAGAGCHDLSRQIIEAGVKAMFTPPPAPAPAPSPAPAAPASTPTPTAPPPSTTSFAPDPPAPPEPKNLGELWLRQGAERLRQQQERLRMGDPSTDTSLPFGLPIRVGHTFPFGR